jgi:hypothetical protein
MVVDALEHPTVNAVRKQTEIATAATWKISATDTDGGHRHFLNTIRPKPERKSRRVRHTIEIVADRVNAGTVGVPGFLQDVMRPQVSFIYGITRRTITTDLDAADVFQNPLGLRNVQPELLPCQMVQTRVVVPVARKFVPVRHDPPDDDGMPLGNPAEHEERGFAALLTEQIQDAAHAHR